MRSKCVCMAAIWCAALALASNEPATSEDRFKGLDVATVALMEEGHFPGVAVAVLRDGKPIYVNTHGMANISTQTPVSDHTVFELASLTKQMTVLAVMTLVEESKLRLDDRISDYIDNTPDAWSGITVDHLVGHTAGFPHRFERTVDGVLLLEYTREDMLSSALGTQMNAEPGTDWTYSDLGYFLLGVVIERVTGQTYDAFMQERFFGPIGMTQTHLLDQRRIVPHAAQGYAYTDGQLERNRRVWQFALTSHFGVMSSLHDMMLWEHELANPRVVNPKAIEATWKIKRTFSTGQTCDTWGYGGGWQVNIRDGQRVLSHGGYAGTAYIRAVDLGLSVIVLTNREDTPDAISPFAIAWTAAHAADPSIPADGYRCWE